MNLTITFTHLTLSTVSIFLLFTGSVFAVGGDDWRPIDPAELALKTPIVEKDADAEALFWEVRVDDGNPGELVFSHYIRVKIFTERGKESQSRIDLTYLDPDKIKDVSARTIKPDGSFVYLNKEDIFDRTITKANALKFKAKSFALPGVEPGGIIEYRWRHVRPYAWANHLALQFQRDIPVQSITYLVRPRGSLLTMHYQGFQMPAGLKFEKLKDGFYRVNLSNATAYREEPKMPPENEVRSWILL